MIGQIPQHKVYFNVSKVKHRPRNGVIVAIAKMEVKWCPLRGLSNQGGVSSLPPTLNEFLTDPSLKRIEVSTTTNQLEQKRLKNVMFGFWKIKWFYRVLKRLRGDRLGGVQGTGVGGGEGRGVSRENYFLADQVGIEAPLGNHCTRFICLFRYLAIVLLRKNHEAKNQSLHYELIAGIIQIAHNSTTVHNEPNCS